MRVWNNLSLKVKLVVAMSLVAALLAGTAVVIVQIRGMSAIHNVNVGDLQQSVADFRDYQNFADSQDRSTATFLAKSPALAAALASGNAAEISSQINLLEGTVTNDLVLVVVDGAGRVLAAYPPSLIHNARPSGLPAGARSPVWLLQHGQLYELMVAPIVDAAGRRVGTIYRGRHTGNDVAHHVSAIVSAPVVISFHGRVVGSSLAAAPLAALEKTSALVRPGAQNDVRLAGTAYALQSVAVGPGDAPLFTVLRPLSAGLVLRSELRHLLMLMGLSVLLLGALLAWMVARAVSRPLALLLDGVQALERGDFKFPLPPSGGDEVGQLAAAVARMRTTLELTRQGMVRSARLDALGQLAGGIAHDFNNLVTVINGFSELMLEKLGPDDPNRRYLNQIHKAGDRAAAVTRELLIFSSHSVGENCMLDLNKALETLRGTLKLLVGESVELHFQPGLDQTIVCLDPSYFERMIVNLAANARDAMPKGGTLTIAVQRLQANPANPDLSAPPSDWVEIAVSDTGVGMSPEVQKRLFEPFFTTKDVGEGSGLGLATVYGIVKQAGGAILVESAPGRGAKFRIILPAETQAVVSAPAPALADEPTQPIPAPMPALPSGDDQGSSQPTILLVDDESELRAMLKEVLESAGFTVVEAGDGVEALAQAAQLQWQFDALITDVAMPRLGGVELARQVRRQRPGLALIYSSGYSERGEAAFEPESHFIAKPYAPDDMVTLLRRLLSRAQAAGV